MTATEPQSGETFQPGFNPFSELTRDKLNAIADRVASYAENEAAIISKIAEPSVQGGDPPFAAIGKITAVTPAGGTSTFFNYDAVSTLGASLSVTGRPPVWRPLNTLEVNPAQVDDPCILFFNDVTGQTEILAITETAVVAPCGQSQPGFQQGIAGGPSPETVDSAARAVAGIARNVMQAAGYGDAQTMDWLISMAARYASAVSGDLSFTPDSAGPILIDRTTATRYRLYVNVGALLIEAV